jgi:hypothetical protein
LFTPDKENLVQYPNFRFVFRCAYPVDTGGDEVQRQWQLATRGAGSLDLAAFASWLDVDCRARLLERNGHDPSVATQISERIWFGGEKVVRDKQFITGAQITHVLNISGDIPHCYSGVAFFRVPINDSIGEDVLRGPNWLDRGLRFLNAALSSHSRARVLVHCAHGISLAPAFVIAFLMRTEKLSVKDALAKVRALQPVVSPGLGLIEQLLEREREWGLAESPSVNLCQYMHHSDPATWDEKYSHLRNANPWFITCPACRKTNAGRGFAVDRVCGHCKHEY